ncbi:MAG: D-alanyl-D-alanine carboxypeptidase family protein [Lysobacterales bacterium]|jgi:LAS superfamily LD-carboxypeptidase LdcB|nr:MAG: D-alanyl-D-alanine carboxypeptidase family protein [Xanthomonadales bacterium]
MNELELTGRARTHIVELEQPHCLLHYGAATSFLAMRDAAARAGIDLVAASGFRDFDRQLAIWNGKWRGERALLDRAGQPLDVAMLDEPARIDAILCWSALPGGSRHHWGTDVDVYDAASLPAGCRLQLVPAEYGPGGPFERLTAWLDEHMAGYGFYRPYSTGECGAGVEPWHLSYWPLASEALESLTLPVLRRAIAESEILGRDEVLERLPEIYTRFILAVDPPAPRAARPSARLA